MLCNTTHSADDLLQLEADSDRTFAGWLDDGRALIPVLVLHQHLEDRRRIVLRLNDSRPAQAARDGRTAAKRARRGTSIIRVVPQKGAQRLA
jgi:hypothetical protein